MSERMNHRVRTTVIKRGEVYPLIFLADGEGIALVWQQPTTRRAVLTKPCPARGVTYFGQHLVEMPASQTRPVHYCPVCLGEGVVPDIKGDWI